MSHFMHATALAASPALLYGRRRRAAGRKPHAHLPDLDAVRLQAGHVDGVQKRMPNLVLNVDLAARDLVVDESRRVDERLRV